MTWAIYDKRTPAQKMQHAKFQQLGTLHRTKANIRNILEDRTAHGTGGYDKLEKLNVFQKDILRDAIEVINSLIADLNIEMKNLPSKKNEKLKAATEVK